MRLKREETEGKRGGRKGGITFVQSNGATCLL